MRRLFLSAIYLLIASFAVTGCAFGPSAGPALNIAADGMRGTLHGGQQPVFGATINLYEVGSSSYGVASTTPKASTTSSLIDGSFAFSAAAYTCTASNTPMYLVATGGTPGGYSTNPSLALMALVPQCDAGMTSSINIDEVTTAAAVLAAGQFMGTALGGGVVPQIGATCTGCATGTYNKGLVAAFSNTYPSLVNNAFGTAVASSTAGTLSVTTEAAKISSFANVLAACVNSNGSTDSSETTTTCGKIFTGVNATSAATRPFNTLQAALEMDLYPYYNVPTVFGYASPTSPFAGLSATPNDWTVAIAFTTTTAALGILQNTSSNLSIDASGNIWFPSNLLGSAGLGAFFPATGAFSSVVTAAGLTYPQYVAVDTSSPAYAWTTDLASGMVLGAPTGTGSSIALSSGVYVQRGGPIVVDLSNTVNFAETGTFQTYLFYIQTDRTSISFDEMSPSLPAPPNALAADPNIPAAINIYDAYTESACVLAMAGNDLASTGTSSCVTGGVANGGISTGPEATDETFLSTNATTNSFCYAGIYDEAGCAALPSSDGPRAIVEDGAGTMWVANSGNASVTAYTYGLTTITAGNYYFVSSLVPVGTGYLHGTNYGGTLTTPYGIGIDASGNVWVSNASCVATSSTPCAATSFTLTEIVGAAAPTITPLSAQGSYTAGTAPTN